MAAWKATGIKSVISRYVKQGLWFAFLGGLRGEYMVDRPGTGALACVPSPGASDLGFSEAVNVAHTFAELIQLG